jgi:hypothetical protein
VTDLAGRLGVEVLDMPMEHESLTGTLVRAMT